MVLSQAALLVPQIVAWCDLFFAQHLVRILSPTIGGEKEKKGQLGCSVTVPL